MGHNIPGNQRIDCTNIWDSPKNESMRDLINRSNGISSYDPEEEKRAARRKAALVKIHPREIIAPVIKDGTKEIVKKYISALSIKLRWRWVLIELGFARFLLWLGGEKR